MYLMVEGRIGRFRPYFQWQELVPGFMYPLAISQFAMEYHTFQTRYIDHHKSS